MPECVSRRTYHDVVSRRKFVALTGTTGAAAVAGCTTGTDDDGNDAEGPFDYDDEDVWFETAQGNFPVDSFHYNMAQGWQIPHVSGGVFAAWTRYDWVNDEFVPHLITEWEHADSSMVLTLSEEFTWGSTGDSITAEDLELQLAIQRNNDDALFDFVDEAEVTGEYELTLHYPEGTRTDFVTYAALNREASFAPSIWADERDNDAPNEVEVPTPDPSGPLAITERESNFHQAEPRDGLEEYEDDAVAGDHYNWNGYRIGYRQSNNAFHTSFAESELDGVNSLFAGPETLDRFPDSVQQYQIPGAAGMGIWPDHSSEPWNDRRVRQALYYSLDRSAIVENVGAPTIASYHPTPTGLTYATVETYLGSENPDGFTRYEYDVERAEALLDEAGYEMGEVSATLVYPAPWSNWAVSAQSFLDQVQSAGWDIEGEGNPEGPGSYITDLGDGFELAVDQHTAPSPTMNIPYFSFDYILRNDLRDAEEHFAGYTKNEVEIDGETIDVDETLAALADAQDESERESRIRDLARVINEDVPVFYISEGYQQSFIDTERFDAPEDPDHAATFYPLWWLPQVDERLDSATDEATPGLLKARTN